MLRPVDHEQAALPVANFIGFILGLISLSVIYIFESIVVFLPLLFAPLVCITLSYLLYVSHRSSNQTNDNDTINPISIDLI